MPFCLFVFFLYAQQASAVIVFIIHFPPETVKHIKNKNFEEKLKKVLTDKETYGTIIVLSEKALFFCVFRNTRKRRAKDKIGGVFKMRVKITLACEECKQRNYNTMKNKKNDPDRLEMKKYCKFCRKHTLHKETK